MRMPRRPYLVRAIHSWVSDNGETPYILVDATYPGVNVPPEHVNDGKIVLNASYEATGGLSIGDDAVSFNARFGGVSRAIYVPMGAVLAVFSKENQDGMMMEPEEQYLHNPDARASDETSVQTSSNSSASAKADPKAPPKGFKVIK